MTFTIAIVGRPNVGKSTLFNRLVGRRLALVDDRPGVTRDRREGEGRLGDIEFTVIDTAGFEESAPESLSGRMRAQTEAAIEQADAIFFMIDARAGVIPADHAFADVARKSGKPIVLVANKSEGTDGWTPMRLASANRCRFRRSIMRVYPTSTTHCALHCRKEPPSK
jgi:GTP-binding protein